MVRNTNTAPKSSEDQARMDAVGHGERNLLCKREEGISGCGGNLEVRFEVRWLLKKCFRWNSNVIAARPTTRMTRHFVGGSAGTSNYITCCSTASSPT